ncbi:7198_t:CDS:2, partial [Acaulospora colombiana]
GKANHNLWITRAYVSTTESVVNGRANWNMPKHLARFEFTSSESSPDVLGVRVYAAKNAEGSENADSPSFNDEPFFAIELKNSKIPLPAVPMDTRIMPYDLTLVQPPLRPSEHPEKDGLIGTSAWMTVLPIYKGKIKPAYIRGLLTGGKISNGVDLPDIHPWSTVIHWP